MRFTRFVAIDWTGAAGTRHAGIAVAECAAGRGAPTLVDPGRRWSRGEVRDWIDAIGATDERALIGIDASFGLPFGTDGFFRDTADSPATARQLWQQIDRISEGDRDLGAHAYVAHRRDFFWTGKDDPGRAERARYRTTETRHRDAGDGVPASCYVLMGPAQVGKASLSAMRLLARTCVPVWPFDDDPGHGSLLVEIYCQAFARLGGGRGKINTLAALDAALGRLDSDPLPAGLDPRFKDHVSDAIVSAAGMRKIAGVGRYWHPPGLAAVRATEGWTFGVA